MRAEVYNDEAVELFWDRNQGNVVFGYEIYKDGDYVGFSNGTSYLEFISEFGSFTYDVIAVDQDGVILGSDRVEVLMGADICAAQ